MVGSSNMGRRRLWLATVGLLLLIALALRLLRLEGQSLWADEGTSVALAPRPLARILQDASHDIHPPLYYLLLHSWVAAIGTSVFAVRSLSVFLGTALVAVTGALGQRWGGRGVALTATIAATLSPFAFHYAQETRMYILVALLGALSWYCLSRLLWPRRPPPRAAPPLPGGRWAAAAYWIATLALLYSHYYSVALLAAQNLAWLGWWLRGLQARRPAWGALWAWAALQGSLTLAYLPWLWYSRETILGWPAISPPVTPSFLARETLRIFSLGPATDPEWSPWLWGFGLLLGAGILTALWRGHRPAPRLAPHPGAPHEQAPVWALLYFLVPPGLMLLLSALDRPFYNPKFLLLALPGYHLLLALGAAALAHSLPQPYQRGRPWVLVGVTAFLSLAAAGPLGNELNQPRYWRDDYRGIARTIAGLAGPRDAVLLDGPGQIEIFDYYYKGDLPRYPLPRQRPLDRAATVAELEAIAARHDTLHGVFWAQREGDPEGIIDQWLANHAFPTGARWFGNVQLAVFRFADPPLQPVGADFGAGLHLESAGWAPPTVAAGDVLALVAAWVWQAPPTAQGTFFAQLLDPANNVVGQYDGAAGLPPLAAWPQGQHHRARLGLPVRPGTPPGRYRLILGLYDPSSGLRWPLTTGADALTLGEVSVIAPAVPPPLEALDILHPTTAPLGGAHLVGSRIHALGADSEPDRLVRPGDPLAVVLFWRATQAAPALPPLTLTLDGPAQHTWPWHPTADRHPPARWTQGEIVRDPQILFVPGHLPPGTYQAHLQAQGLAPIPLGPITIAPP